MLYTKNEIYCRIWKTKIRKGLEYNQQFVIGTGIDERLTIKSQV